LVPDGTLITCEPEKGILIVLGDGVMVALGYAKIFRGIPEVVALAVEPVKHVPLNPETSSVTTSPGLKVLGAFTSVLTGSVVEMAVENGAPPFNLQVYDGAVIEEVKVIVSPVQKFNLGT